MWVTGLPLKAAGKSILVKTKCEDLEKSKISLIRIMIFLKFSKFIWVVLPNLGNSHDVSKVGDDAKKMISL